jgi:hypothetical protein
MQLPAVIIRLLAAVGLLVPIAAVAAPYPALDLRSGRVFVGARTAELRMEGQCQLPSTMASLDPMAEPVEVKVAGTTFWAAPPRPGSPSRASLVLDSALGERGRIWLHREQGASGPELSIRAVVGVHASHVDNPLALQVNVGTLECGRVVIFRSARRHRTRTLTFPWTGSGDVDRDGSALGDCRPGDPSVHPGAVDVCGNGLDEDCDGRDAVCDPPLFPGLRVSDRSDDVIGGDLNHDGITDLITPAFGSGGEYMQILFGRGDGRFQDGPQLRASEIPRARAIGDLDGDGHADVVAANLNETTVAVFFGDGRGQFTTEQRVSVGRRVYTVVLIDVDGDGLLDIVTANGDGEGTDGSISVVHGLPGRKFSGPTFVRTIPGLLAIAAGDVNGNGSPDLVVANGERVAEVLIGKGDGRFIPGQTVTTEVLGSALHGVVLGRFDGDDALDLAVSGFGHVVTFRGRGDGTFLPGVSYDAGEFSAGIAAGDLDRDGNVDLAVGGGQVLIGDGHGGFAVRPSLGPGGTSVVIGRFAGTTASDVAFGSSVYLARDAGSRSVAAPLFAQALAAVDVNHDGNQDYVLAGGVETDSETGAELGRVAVVYGSTGGQLTVAQVLEASGSERDGAFSSVAVGDFNGDGHPDIAAGRKADHTIYVFRGRGDGTFGPATRVPLARYLEPDALATADLDGNGIADLVATTPLSREVAVLLGSPQGFGVEHRFAAGRDVTSSASDTAAVAIADLNGDTIPDLAVTSGESVEVAVLRGLGDGTFAPQTLYKVHGHATSVVANDVDGDHVRDLVVASLTGEVSVLRGNGDGTFQAAQQQEIIRSGLTSGFPLVTIGAADVDGDGVVDIAASGLFDGNVWLARGLGDGSFEPAQGFAASTAFPLAIADANRDGFPDLVTMGGFELRILLQQSCRPTR